MKSDSTVRFFNRVDYYSCHGSDGLFAAREVFKSTSACKQLGLLLVKRYRVEVYVNKGTNRNQQWSLEFKGSPGNLSQFEDILFVNSDIGIGTSIIAVKLGSEGKSRLVGVSCVDPLTTVISVCEFLDDESYSDLEALVVTTSPKECLLLSAEGNKEFQNIKDVMERNNVLVTLRKKNDFSTDSLIQDLNSLLKFKKGQQENSQALPETSLDHAMSSTAALIKYLDLTSDAANINQYRIKQLERSRYLKLDGAAIKALNIDPPPGLQSVVSGGSTTSIQGLLDKCRTPLGHRLVSQWVRQPLKDLALIKERHDIVEQLVNNNDLRKVLSEDHLRRVPDLEQLAKKVARKNGSLQDCYKIYMCLMHIPIILETLSSSDDNTAAMKTLIIEPLKELISDLEKFQEMVEQTIDLESSDSGEFLVKPEFNEDLKDMKETMENLKNKMEKEIKKVGDDLNFDVGKTIKLDSTLEQGYFFRVTLKEEVNLRNNKKYEIFETHKSGVKFRSYRMTEINTDYLSTRNKYEEEQKSVVIEILQIAASYSNLIKSVASTIAILDVLTAFAIAAVNSTNIFVRPNMVSSEEGILNIKQARHPCLDTQPDVHYIANDCAFKRDESQFFIITGPNMGGKSTYMKSVGVVALMAHIGSFVPCEEATISLLDCILARVGADDSQEKGVSTFMIEMVETATILKTATSNSLVIIDELGRGTSTYDGRGIAWSIAEYLAKEIKPYCLFATHFHEIARLAEDVPTVKNYHVSAIVEKDDIIFLYTVKPGICDQSFGIHVAKMVNFPSDIIKFAEKKQAELEDGENISFKGYKNAEEKRKIVAEGEKLIAKFVTKCKELDESLSEKELLDKITSYKNETIASGNPYIAALLAEA
ncbi:hypothetical protein HCN44_008342 [Aphidius gifuensis]|uniref:DNA mismatch repair proteins mutS family domain-containing protein n=1 Tax=Aphidius gifuensis TaxID=684658 RepID=A0A834XLY7_APHGI|nr:hypothetical protein HCN44_008342 [Aphidius gifuensis]